MRTENEAAVGARVLGLTAIKAFDALVILSAEAMHAGGRNP